MRVLPRGDILHPIGATPRSPSVVKALLAVAAAFALLLAGVSASEPILVGAVPDQLVEGHAVFTTIEIVNASVTSSEHFAAAVAVLVRELIEERRSLRFPGVLWFNDQYLTGPQDERIDDHDVRYPCSGAVLAMNDGSTDVFPTDANGTYYHGNNSTYVESYSIRDVHDNAWIVDKWRLPSGRLLWSVPIMNDQLDYSERDDGACEGSVYSDTPCGGVPSVGVGCLQVGPPTSGLPLPSTHARSPGDNDWGYPCGNATAPCVPILYNALLYLRLEDLDVPSLEKNHTEESADWWDDASGCDARTADYPCPDDDDDREGNSHPFNPERPWPAQRYDGRENHGGSDDCVGNGTLQQECHGTRLIRIVFGYAAAPLARDYWLIDVPGSDAPYHCHEGNLCGAEDAWMFLPP